MWGISARGLTGATWAAFGVYGLFILDRLSMQIGVVNAVYLRSISLSDDEVTQTLSTGTSLDHFVSIIAAALCGIIWTKFGAQWVFFFAAFFSLGNLVIAILVQPEKEAARTRELREELNA